MKKHSFIALTKRSIGALLIATLISANTNAAEIAIRPAFDESTATVRYLGSDSNSYSFSVSYNNEGGEKFLLRITDEAGNTLFTGTYSEKKFERRFRLMKEDVAGKLNFVFRSLKDNSVQTFQVTTTSQVIEDVVIKKVN